MEHPEAALHLTGPLTRAATEAKGPIVVALPGAGCSPAIYDQGHCGGLPWHAVDWLAGEGPFDPVSIAGRIAAGLRARQGPTVLVGHSLGAFIALLVAIRHDGLAHALVLSNSGARIDGHGDPALPDRIRTAWDETNRAAFLRSCFECEPPPALFATMAAYLASLDPQRLLEAVLGLRRLDVSAELARVRCPTLIAHGRADRRRPPAAAQALAAGIPESELEFLPGGHTPMVDDPAAYRAVVGRFLERALAAPDPIHPRR
jgi:pimeloyl-ACP methyl ester carboxylesterase